MKTSAFMSPDFLAANVMKMKLDDDDAAPATADESVAPSTKGSLDGSYEWADFCNGRIEMDRLINESLRYDPPLLAMFRTTAAEEEVAGVTIPANTKVMIPYAAANRDPAGNPESGGRWYPTLTTLGNGQVLCVGGHPDLREEYPSAAAVRHSNNTPEIYRPGLFTPGQDHPGHGTWFLLASNPPEEDELTSVDGDWDYDYQRCHLLTDGRVFFTSSSIASPAGRCAISLRRLLTRLCSSGW